MTRGRQERDSRSQRRPQEIGNEAPMVITPQAVVDLARRAYRLLRRSPRHGTR